jgi:hypothetical protein
MSPGPTGQNVLDPQQPIYALASVHVDEDAANALADEILIPGQTELKFSSLRGSARGREGVIAAFESGLLDHGSARVTPVHKPFMVVAKLFDRLIEPEFHERGIDLYSAGGHMVFVNMLYRYGSAGCGIQRLAALLNLCGNGT